jgi:hypothetical protein
MTIKTSVDESINRLAEEQLYVKVNEELSTGRTREGIWFKALAESEGDITKAKALYVKYRVQSLKDELVIEQQVQKNIDNDVKIHGLKLILAIIIRKSPRAIRYIVSIICWGFVKYKILGLCLVCWVFVFHFPIPDPNLYPQPI